VEAPYYAHIARDLLAGAVGALDAVGAAHERITVPGAFEIPAAIRLVARAGETDARHRYDGYVALGCVIRGETTHYDYVCGESARALMDLTVKHKLPPPPWTSARSKTAP